MNILVEFYKAIVDIIVDFKKTMLNRKEFKKSFFVAIWFILLTFPIMAIKVNTIEKTIHWQWERIIFAAYMSFILSLFWRFFLIRKERGRKSIENGEEKKKPIIKKIKENKKLYYKLIALICTFFIAYPFMFGMYHTNTMSQALTFIILGLGLNIVVGLAGLLDLGYVAFYLLGAYTYALLNVHYSVGFWVALPVGAGLAALFGVLLGFPVLRLRGDYLAIVTLGFGEILRLIMENWNEFSFGPSGIKGIPRPSLFGFNLDSINSKIIYMYFIILAGVLFTIFVVNRLQYSRIGRAWMALREDEIACQAMGIDKVNTKLTAFSLGATWAGIAGVIFAGRITFINPASFTLWESVGVLCIVVLGGIGSIPGVIIGALVYTLLPEIFREFQQYRMIVFPIMLVIMMIFRPQGFISDIRTTYKIHKNNEPVK